MRRFRLSMRTRHYLEGYGFVSLWIVGFFLFMAVPLGRSLFFSFHKLSMSQHGLVATYVGGDHYRAAFVTDVNFLPLLRDTMVTMLTHVPLVLVFSMFSALLLNRRAVGRILFRGIFFLPVIIASGAVLRKLLELGAGQLPIFRDYDLFNLLGRFIPGQVLMPLLEFADSLTLVMWDAGVQTLIFLAGLQTISPQLYEAARCDGATAWESFWKITFPMILPMVFVNVLYSLVNSFTKTDNRVMDHILNVVFRNNDFGYGSAIGWMYFLMIAAVLGLVFALFRKSLANVEGRGGA